MSVSIQSSRTGSATVPTPTGNAAPPSVPHVASADEVLNKINFLLRMSQRFEEDGNLVESVKSHETALLLRKNSERTYSQLSDMFEQTLLKQAQDLVLKCNSVAVEEFQRNSFDVASFLLNKALFLTEEFEETNCFGDAEHDRLRLRAATYNNLGCMEKRRGKLQVSLDHLQKAAQLEVSVDPDVGASPSTYLNLCTILNKLGNHVSAVSAAQRAVNTLRFQAQQGADEYPNYPIMLAVAYYNLGASLESCDRPGDVAEAVEAYSNSVDTGRRYQLDPKNQTITSATEALRRLQGLQPATMMLPPVSRSGSVSPRVFAPTPGALTKVGEIMTPLPPSTKKEGSLGSNTFRVPLISGRGVNKKEDPEKPGTPHLTASSKLGDAALRHAERIQARQKKKEQNAERDQVALQRAQRAHVREKEEKLRREREAEAVRRDEMARALYEKMVNGLRAEEIKRVRNAAKKIQKVWRGKMARTLVKKMIAAAVQIQAVVRSFLCRLRIKRAEEEQKLQAVREAQMRKQVHAAVAIQRKVRQFIQRLEILRQYQAKKLRRNACAKKIQRTFRAYSQRREQRITAQLEAEKSADERRTAIQHEAAKKIQGMFRSFKMRRITRIVALEQKRRGVAATKIQAVMRGALTRVWFKHYRLYRRQQELSSSKNLRLIIKIQAAWRGGIARRLRRRLLTEKRYKDRMALLFSKARRIQCAWRCWMARAAVRPLRENLKLREESATIIQRRYNVYKCRSQYIVKRDAMRRDKAARMVQVWFRERMIINKHKEMARYHAKIQRQHRIALLRTQSAVLLQSILQARMSSLIVGSMRAHFMRLSKIATVIQKACRGYLSRFDTSVIKKCAQQVDEDRRVTLRRFSAACVIQRATRCYLAKTRVEQMRIRRAAALEIQKTYRMFQAKKELRRLKAEKRRGMEERAVKLIQKLARKFLRKLELRRLDEYYSEKNRQKLAQLRREEAAVAIQSIWRGHATRRETTAERNRLLQNTIDAIRIQRQFRAFRFRRQINAEILHRQSMKKIRRSAAIRIQSFWRGTLAKEYVSVLQEQRYNLTVCAIAIQCAWRKHRAVQELKKRREARLSQQVLKANQHDVWIDAVNIVGAFLRCKQDQKQTVGRRKRALIAQLTESERSRYVKRNTAATKIQAVYRGYYERAYARGLRREKREREEKAKLIQQRQNSASIRIQLAWKCAKAREVVNKRRITKRLAFLEQQIERETVADPQDLVKRMFWSHEAVLKRDLTKERRQRHDAADRAAIIIQRNVRRMIAMKRYKALREQKQHEEAARRIQQQWKEHEAEAAKKREIETYKSAVRIQALVRGVLTRFNWAERQRRLTQRRGTAVHVEDLKDQAAIKIQSAWRMYYAKCKADGIRHAKLQEKHLQLKFESARLIQRQFRLYLLRKQAKAEANRRRQLKKQEVLAPRRPSAEGAPKPPPRTYA